MFLKPWMRVLRDAEPGGGGGGGFDPAKFRQELLGEVGNLLKHQAAEITNALRPAEKKPDDRQDEKPPDQKPDDGKTGKTADPAMQALQSQMRDLQGKLDASERARAEAVKAAEERERMSAIRGKLGDFQFASDAARESALRIFGGDIVRGEDGTLLGPDKTTPADEYIAKALEETHDYLLKPKNVGGAGTVNHGSKRMPPVDLDDIKPGMSADDRARVLAQISQLG